jgi:hypothetical protein
MVADCKSAGLTPYVGSNPTPTIRRTGGQTDGRTVESAGRADVRICPTDRQIAGPPRGCSSVGRASAFQAEGRGFESRRPLTGTPERNAGEMSLA